MPIYKTKNENFFKKWSPEMAYVLGFFAADGSMYKTKRGTHFIEFQITDKELLKQIRKLFVSNHKVTMRNRKKEWKPLYRLQIGSKVMFGDLIKLGMTQRKSKTLKFPDIPVDHLSHFVRGYFDGDGNVWSGLMHKTDRKKPSKTLMAGFTCGSKEFLVSLMKALKARGGLIGGSLQYHSRAYRLHYSTADAARLYKFMSYGNNRLGLERKSLVFERFLRRRGPVV